jgi:hypothetical protein
VDEVDEYDVDSALQQALDRLTVVADVNSALASTMDPREGLARASRLLAQRVGDWCAVDLLAAAGGVRRACTATRDGVDAPAADTARLPPTPVRGDGPLARVLRGAGPVLVTSEDLRSGGGLAPWDAAAAAFIDRHGANSAIAAPLCARREVLGALTVMRGDGHPPLSTDELALVEDVGQRVGLAVDNARLHREVEHVAERLQRSLLPALPGVDHLDLAARYVTSQRTAEVGGDWYDCFRLSGGGTAVIIGDVTGHDLRAAVSMSQLRNMLRGIACDRQEPPEAILRRLDLAQHTLYPTTTATCVYGIIDGPGNGRWHVEFSSAGHLPPLLVSGDGETRYLDQANGLLLGVDTRLPRTSATVALPAGSTLLLYTDGLIERRGEGLDHGMTRLRREAAALARETPDAFCDGLLAGLSQAPADDVALLAVSVPDDAPDPEN